MSLPESASIGGITYYPVLRENNSVGVLYHKESIDTNYKTLNDIVKENLEAISSSLSTDPNGAQQQIIRLKRDVSELKAKGRAFQYHDLQGEGKGIIQKLLRCTRRIEIVIRSILGRFCVPGCFYYNRDTEIAKVIAKVEAEVNNQQDISELDKFQKTTSGEHKRVYEALKNRTVRDEVVNEKRVCTYEMTGLPEGFTMECQGWTIHHVVVIKYEGRFLYIGFDDSQMHCFWGNESGATKEANKGDLVPFAYLYNDYFINHCAPQSPSSPVPSLAATEQEKEEATVDVEQKMRAELDTFLSTTVQAHQKAHDALCEEIKGKFEIEERETSRECSISRSSHFTYQGSQIKVDPNVKTKKRPLNRML